MTNLSEITKGLYEALKLIYRAPKDPFARAEATKAMYAYEQSLAQPEDLDQRVRTLEGQ